MRNDPLLARLASANPAPTAGALPDTAPRVDPIEARLMDAVRRESSTAPGNYRFDARMPWRRAHPLTAIAACLLICASAAAAVVSLTSSSSEPLAGQVPGTHIGRQTRMAPQAVSGDSYQITVAPAMEAGDAGWCTSIVYSVEGRLSSGSGGCGGGGDYPTTARPLFGSSGISRYPGRAPSGDTVGYVLTGPRVSAVRIGSSTILAKTEPGLPAGDKAAVFFLPTTSPPVMIPPVGTLFPYDIEVPSPSTPPGHKHPRLVQVIPMLAIDGSGEVIRYGNAAHSSPRGGVRFWDRRASRALRQHGIADHPLPGACELEQTRLPTLTAEWGRTVKRITPRANIEGQAFASCINTWYGLDGWPLQAAVLLDAHEPGRTLTSIPGAQPVPGHPGTVNVPLSLLPGAITARREGNGWLVVQGGHDETQRLDVLKALHISKLAIPR